MMSARVLPQGAGSHLLLPLSRPDIIVVMQECDISVGHLNKWALRVVERCVLSAAPGQSTGEKKHHDTIRDKMAALSHVLCSISRGGTQWIYGGRLFVVFARTNTNHHHHHHHHRARMLASGSSSRSWR
jgi:hypothetical protein